MIGETAQLAVELKLKDQGFASSLARDEAGLKRLNTTVGKTGGAFSAVSKHIGGFQKNIGNAFNNVGKGAATAASNIQKLAFAAGALAVGGGIAAIKWAGEFEAQLNTINTIARETPEGLSKIGDTIRQIARESGTPLEELTQGYYDLLSAGIKAADAPKVLAQANKLAIGGLASAAETVDLLTTAINVYGGDASQAAQFTDEFAKAIERGKVTAAEIAGSYAQVAPLAKSLGVENKELAAGYATLTAAGTPAAEAATQMASALTALLKTTPGLEGLQKATKKNYAAIAGKQGLNEAFAQMRVDAEKAGIKLVDLVGRKEALLYILQTTGPNQKKYNADLLAMGDAAGTAAEQMAERQQGLNYELKILKAGVRDAGIEIGSALLPKLTPLIGKLNTFLQGNREGIKKFGADLANAFETAAEWIGKIDFSQVASSLQLAGGFAKGLIGAFLSAPQWLQTAVITGWGLNKLTGGAVQNVMADLTKAVIGGALQQFVVRGATPANPLFVMDVSGGLGKLGGVAGTAAAGASLATALIAALPIAAGAAIVYATAQNKGAFDPRDLRRRQGTTVAQTTEMFGSPTSAGGSLTGAIGDAIAKLFQSVAKNPAIVSAGQALLRKGVVDRATAAGRHPTEVAIQRTLDKNAAHVAEIQQRIKANTGDTVSELVRVRLAVLAAGVATGGRWSTPPGTPSGVPPGTPGKKGGGPGVLGPGHHLAGGGPAWANQDYLIGERGPEILRMGSRSGTVMPNGGSPPVIHVAVAVPTRDININRVIKSRMGPSVAETGAI